MAKGRILIVDDEPQIVKAITTFLSGHGYEISAAYNGEEGIIKAKGFKPDLIILDILMPGMDGATMAAALRDNPETKNIPVIFLTCLAGGAGEPQSQEKIIQYVPKPFGTKELLEAVTKMLGE